MKKLYSLVVLMALLGSASPVIAQKKHKPDSVDVVIKFNRPFLSTRSVDSVLIFFDRFNHTGAGVVRQVFHPQNNQLTIHKVPEGRYFVGVLCMGMYQHYFYDIQFFNKKRDNELRFKLPHSDAYMPGYVYIPVTSINLRKLCITNGRSFK
jgi:hypothetical protein